MFRKYMGLRIGSKASVTNYPYLDGLTYLLGNNTSAYIYVHLMNKSFRSTIFEEEEYD